MKKICNLILLDPFKNIILFLKLTENLFLFEQKDFFLYV